MKATTTLIGCALLAGCHTFSIHDCRTVTVSRYDWWTEDGCDATVHRTQETHCVILDEASRCRVGALRKPNPDFRPRSGHRWLDFWLRSSSATEFLYTKMFEWECPPGVRGPVWLVFPFSGKPIKGFQPKACDKDEPVYLSNPLLGPWSLKRPPWLESPDSPSDGI